MLICRFYFTSAFETQYNIIKEKLDRVLVYQNHTPSLRWRWDSRGISEYLATAEDLRIDFAPGADQDMIAADSDDGGWQRWTPPDQHP